MDSQNGHSSQPTNDKINALYLEVEKAKESERKMLVSVVSQTKVLEETRIALQEAKSEIRILQGTIQRLEALVGRKSLDVDKHVGKGLPTDIRHAHDEIVMLRNELWLATQAEEKAKKALDDFAIALKEVTTEANRTKSTLSATESQLQNVRMEADHSKSCLKTTEDKLKAVIEELEMLKSEMQESLAGWAVKENGLIDCMKVSETEMTAIRQENNKLIELQKSTREENSKLRNILKQAVNEATVLKEAMEIARNENSTLADSLSQKERALQSLQHNYETLKINEAAAVDSLNKLKGMLAGSSMRDTIKSGIPPNIPSKSKPASNDGRSNRSVIRVPSDSWRADNPRAHTKHRHSIGEPAKFKGPLFDSESSPEWDRDRLFASVSNISDLRFPSSVDSGEVFDDFEHMDSSHIESMYNETRKKKKTVFQKFGNMLRRRSFHK